MQHAYSFDRESVIKMVKGALIAMTGAAALAGLDYLGTIEMSNPFIATAVAFVVPTLVNIVKEWIKGE